MKNEHDFINPTLARSIEDAILFGNVKELDAILKIIEIDTDFPMEMLYGLQALRHFRAYYGKDGVLAPTEKLEKQKAILMETAWGAELLDNLRSEHKNFGVKQA